MELIVLGTENDGFVAIRLNRGNIVGVQLVPLYLQQRRQVWRLVQNANNGRKIVIIK